MTRPVLDLLLAHADDSRPVLEHGLDREATHHAPRPDDGLNATGHLGDPTADANDLPRQRWGIIAPEGDAGDRLLEQIGPLRTHREQQQAHPAEVYRVPPGMSARDAIGWKQDSYAPESVDEEDLPRYLLILGDLDQVSPELQHVLATDCFPGRLAFSVDDAYRAYADKAVAWEQGGGRSDSPRLLSYTVHDGSSAVHRGYRALVRPGLERAQKRLGTGKLRARAVEDAGEPIDPEPDELLELAGTAEGDLLFTLGHGAGAPRGGWGSRDEQRVRQGALSFGRGATLPAEELARQPFLPGGVWFNLSCFGAGTPNTSAFAHWLEALREQGEWQAPAAAVLAGLPPAGEEGFISSTAQAALANPRGPLAFIGHLDLAWSYSFEDAGGAGSSRAARFLNAWQQLVHGTRAAPALFHLLRHFGEANLALTTDYDAEQRAVVRGTSHEVDRARRGRLWMLRQDLLGFVLLGDPAVRLRTPASDREPAEPRQERRRRRDRDGRQPRRSRGGRAQGREGGRRRSGAGGPGGDAEVIEIPGGAPLEAIDRAIALRIEGGATVDVEEEIVAEGDERTVIRRTIRIRD